MLPELSGAVSDVFGLNASGLLPGGNDPKRLALGAAQITMLGLVAAIEQLVKGFRSAVVDWRRAAARRTDGIGPELRESLFVLCRSFEISMEVLPAFGGPETVGPAGAPEEAIRRALLRELLDLVRSRKIAPIPVTPMPLAKANEALVDLQKGRLVGRAVLTP